MKDLTEQIYDELNAQVVRMLNHSLAQASRIVELETQLKDHSAQAFSIGETYANALLRIAELEAQLAGVLTDTERLNWLDSQVEGYGFEGIQEGNRWHIDGPFYSLRHAIDECKEYDERTPAVPADPVQQEPKP